MVAQALSDLVVYTQSVKFTSFGHARLHQHPYQNTSLGEKKAHKLAKTSGKTIKRANGRTMQQCKRKSGESILNPVT